MSLTEALIQQESQNTYVLANPTAGDGVTPLTNANAICKITIIAQRGQGATLVNAATMTYSGVSTWTYTDVPANVPNGANLLVKVLQYAIDGTTLQRTYLLESYATGTPIATPATALAGTYGPVVGSSFSGAVYDKGGAVFEASAYGASRNSATLALALAAAAAAGSNGTVRVTGPGWTWSQLHGIPGGVKLQFRGCTFSVANTGGLDVFQLGNKATVQADGGTYGSLAATANISRLFTNANHVGPGGQEWCAILGEPGSQIQVLGGAVVGVALVDLVCAYVNTTVEGWTFDGLGNTAAPMIRIASGNTSFGPVLVRNVWCANSTAAQIVINGGALGAGYNSDVWLENVTAECNSAGTMGIQITGTGELRTVSLRNIHLERHVTDSITSHGIYIDGANVLAEGINYSMSNGAAGTSYPITIANNSVNHVIARAVSNYGATTLLHDLKNSYNLTGSYLQEYGTDTSIAQDGIATRTLAGTPIDGYFQRVFPGMVVFDSTANKLWVRDNSGTWRGVAVT